MTDNIEPLPCPFCGEPPCIYERTPDWYDEDIDDYRYGWQVECHGASCDITPSLRFPRHKRDDAVFAWNTRSVTVTTGTRGMTIKNERL